MGKGKIRLIVAICSIFSISGATFADDSTGEPGRSNDAPNPLKNVYFGEQHLHTQNSPDAFAVGTRGTWEDAYNWALGKEVKLSTTGETKSRPPIFRQVS